jgi:hypothetical protein
MLERRSDIRGRVFYCGRIAFNGRKSTLDCTVRNFSPSGAKVQFASAPMLPDDVDLSIEHKGVAYLAHLIWQRQDEAGFLFRNPVPLRETVSLDGALRQRASERVQQSLQHQGGKLPAPR